MQIISNKFVLDFAMWFALDKGPATPGNPHELDERRQFSHVVLVTALVELILCVDFV